VKRGKMGEAKRKFKSVRTLTGQNQYRKYDLWEVGDIVIGTVVDFGEDKYKKKCPVILVDEAMFKDKAENKRVLGKRLLINSCGKIAKRVTSGDIALGLTIQIEYLGKNVMEKGLYAGKEAHDVNIDIMEEEGAEDESGL
jgi:hypothetical protein